VEKHILVWRGSVLVVGKKRKVGLEEAHFCSTDSVRFERSASRLKALSRAAEKDWAMVLL
jgi:hypothetical protein